MDNKIKIMKLLKEIAAKIGGKKLNKHVYCIFGHSFIFHTFNQQLPKVCPNINVGHRLVSNLLQILGELLVQLAKSSRKFY